MTLRLQPCTCRAYSARLQGCVKQWVIPKAQEHILTASLEFSWLYTSAASSEATSLEGARGDRGAGGGSRGRQPPRCWAPAAFEDAFCCISRSGHFSFIKDKGTNENLPSWGCPSFALPLPSSQPWMGTLQSSPSQASALIPIPSHPWQLANHTVIEAHFHTRAFRRK